MKQSLSEWINTLQQQGQYYFTRTQALSVLKCREKSLSIAIYRLAKKNRLMNIRSGFYVIVPIEHSYRGVLSPTWFINDLMQYLHCDYYVGLLSAAALYGVSHQAPQIFQVMTPKKPKNVESKGLSIHFYENKLIGKVPIELKSTPTGNIKVAAAAVIACDIIKYMSSAGGLYNVATVLSELIEHINVVQLTDIINQNLYDKTIIHRLGFLLDHKDVGGKNIANTIYKTVQNQYTFRNTLLNPFSNQKAGELDEKWHIIVNDEIEVEL